MQNQTCGTTTKSVAEVNSSTSATMITIAVEPENSFSASTTIDYETFSDMDDDIFYSQLFSQDPSNAPSETSSAYSSDTFGGDLQLHQSRYTQLYNKYNLSITHLQEYLKEVDSLRRENEALRLANAELAHRLSVLSNCLLSDFNRLGITTNSPSSATELGGQNVPVERFSLPKSISVRSDHKVKPYAPGNSIGSHLTHYRRAREFVPEPRQRQDEALKIKVFNQGMSKTELCNKWQETGMCPYGDNCQFAHGIHELRPVIRHPRYKTAVCRMVLAGDKCPYGHRCHFRHNLTDEERLIATKSIETSN
ncbi:hypothetical protein Leryth_015933 [Lithospermum erythrorhizon]|nr:hypothetical protein Leryth_015933 [Lithospermum erythrorhizon]